MKNFPIAEQEFRGMIEEGSRQPLAYHGLGLSLVCLQKYKEACQCLRRFLQEVQPQYQHLVADVNTLIKNYCTDGL